MKKILFLFLITLLSLTSCTTIKTVVLLKNGKVRESSYYKDIPLEISKGAIGMIVKINGKDCFLFFDTGAMNVLSEKVFNELNLKAKVEVPATDVHSNQDMFYFSKVGAIEISGITYKNTGAAIFDFSRIPELECFNIDGILGANLMCNSIWQIDMQDSVIHITDNMDNLQISESAFTLNFDPNISSTPTVSIKVGDIEFNNVIFDFGASGGVDLVCDNLNLSGLKVNSTVVEHYGSQSLGLFGGNNDTTFSMFVDTMQLGGLVLSNHQLHIRKTGLSTIGTEIFQNYIVTIDWNKNLIYLEPQQNFINAETDNYGVAVRKIDGKLQVIGLNNCTEAYVKGLQIGDQILKINNTDYSTMTDDQYCNIFQNGLFDESSNTVEITFERDSIVKTIQINRKDWYKNF